MSADARPAGLDAFSLCPRPGCITMVWASPRVNFPCREHGGPIGLIQYDSPDEYGLPRTDTGGVPPPPVLRSLEA